MRVGILSISLTFALVSTVSCRQDVNTQFVYETRVEGPVSAIILEPVFSPSGNLMGVTLTNNSSIRFAIAVHQYSLVTSASPKVMYPFVFEDMDIESEVLVIRPGKSTFLTVSFDSDTHERPVASSESFELTFRDLKKLLKESKVQSQYVADTIQMIESGHYVTGQLTLKYTSTQNR